MISTSLVSLLSLAHMQAFFRDGQLLKGGVKNNLTILGFFAGHISYLLKRGGQNTKKIYFTKIAMF